MKAYTVERFSFRWTIAAAFLGIALMMNGCQQKKANPPRVWVARVGERYITPKEFRLFYELDPNFGLDSIGFPAVVGELQTMTDQILSFKQAQKDGLLKDALIRKALQWERRQAMLRALYRKRIGSKIKISEADLRQAYLQKNQMVHVRHLFTKDKAQAEKWHRLLTEGKASFNQLASQAFTDSTLKHNGGDLGWVKISELDKDFVRGLDTLRAQEISGPVHTHWGYHIIQMIDRKQPAIIRESDFNRQRLGLTEWLRQKKGLQRARIYIRQTIGRLNPQPDARLFVLMWAQLTGKNNVESFKSKQPIVLDDRILDRFQYALKPYLKKAFIHYKGGHVTLDEFITAMRQIPLSQRPRFRTAHELSLQIAKWFRDEYLFNQARKEGLADDPQVNKEVQRFAEQELYYYYVNQIVDTLRTPPEVSAYFKKKDHSNPPRELRHFNTLQEWKWSRAQRILHQRLQKLPIKVEVNIPLLKQESKNIDWQGNVRMFMVRKPS